MFRITFQTTLKNALKPAAWTISITVAGFLLSACIPGSTQKGEYQVKSPPPGISADKLAVVDCVLPGRFVRFGYGPPILLPRKPIKTTVYECEDRGGEQGVSSLEVWLSDAEKGDKVAQTQVGEIYARGREVKQDYARAAEWYRKAAEQGDARAQTNLGFLYEKGLGVPKDPLTALNWQRKAAGLGELDLGSASTTQLLKDTQERDRLKNESESLRQKWEQTQQQLEKTQEELKKAQLKLQSINGGARIEVQRNIERLEAQLREREAADKRLRHENRELNEKLNKILSQSSPQKILISAGVEMGPYYALIIGNSDYVHWDKLMTSINDAKKLDEILRSKYGFTTKVLIDADRDKIANAFEEYRTLAENDHFNLLIYYSGHGQLDPNVGYGYWLPVDADHDNRVKWIQNEEIANKLDIIPAAKHVLVIADSCYSGAMMNPIPAVLGDMSPEDQRLWFENISQKKSRTFLSSGGLEPVLATGVGVGGSEHSVFAQALIEVLEKNEDVMAGSRLYGGVEPLVYIKANKAGVHQDPQYKTFKGHESSEFIFIPKTNVTNVERKIIKLQPSMQLGMIGEK